MVDTLLQLVMFRLDAQRYALPLAMVERAVRAVEVTPLPQAPTVVHGVIDVRGRVLPVMNVRRRFHLPEQTIDPDSQFLLVRTAQRSLVLVVDEALGVIARPASEIVEATRLGPGTDQIQGFVTLPDGLVMIQDLEKFLSADEAHHLDAALNQGVTLGA